MHVVKLGLDEGCPPLLPHGAITVGPPPRGVKAAGSKASSTRGQKDSSVAGSAGAACLLASPPPPPPPRALAVAFPTAVVVVGNAGGHACEPVAVETKGMGHACDPQPRLSTAGFLVESNPFIFQRIKNG